MAPKKANDQTQAATAAVKGEEKSKPAIVTGRTFHAAKNATPKKTVTEVGVGDAEPRTPSPSSTALVPLPPHNQDLHSTPSLVTFSRNGGPDLTDLCNASTFHSAAI